MKILFRPEPGDMVVYHPPGAAPELCVVDRVGLSVVWRERITTAVQFIDATWALVDAPLLPETAWGNGKMPLRAWVPDVPEVAAALRGAKWVAEHGPGVGKPVYHLLLEDWDCRRGVVKLYHGEKKEKDEMFWETDKEMKKRLGR